MIQNFITILPSDTIKNKFTYPYINIDISSSENINPTPIKWKSSLPPYLGLYLLPPFPPIKLQKTVETDYSFLLTLKH